MPTYDDIDWTGLDFTPEQFESIMDIDREEWKLELSQHAELFEKMYIEHSLKDNNYDMHRTAIKMDICERTLHRKIEKYSIAV
jgi:transcriptional regulator with PAS, ATPase and Fis domain